MGSINPRRSTNNEKKTFDKPFRSPGNIGDRLNDVRGPGHQKSVDPGNNRNNDGLRRWIFFMCHQQKMNHFPPHAAFHISPKKGCTWAALTAILPQGWHQGTLK